MAFGPAAVVIFDSAAHTISASTTCGIRSVLSHGLDFSGGQKSTSSRFEASGYPTRMSGRECQAYRAGVAGLGDAEPPIGALQVTFRYDPLLPMLLGSAAQRSLGSLRGDGHRCMIGAAAAAGPRLRRRNDLPDTESTTSPGGRDGLTRAAVVARRTRWRVVAHMADERVFRK
jgi:hypothetical protein